MDPTAPPRRRTPGRPAVSSREHIERVAIRLFREHGYAATTIPMIAEAAGVSRTSVFRYWGTKPEIVWGAFDVHTQRLARLLDAADAARPTMCAVRECVVENLGRSIEDSGQWMERFALLDSAPELRSEGSAHWLGWAAVVAAFVARRHGVPEGGVVAQSVGGAVQAAFLAVLRGWLTEPRPSAALLPELDRELAPLCDVLESWLDSTRREG
ncbi:TetR family transcriptional regulator [Streptomyces sp. NPDC093109]|uniref:acyl-CoA-like ligand-binding transcription factor n=1 Tax=Streptomyces sp. NPDC093109 TaxID=3154977 RepID=UPI00344D74CD